MAARYYNELLSYFARAVKDAHAAADIVQESYLRLVTLQRGGEAVSEPRALLYRIGRNLVIDRHRRGQSHGEVAIEDGEAHELAAQRGCEPESRLASAQVLRLVLAAIDALPMRCREAFILHRFDGLSHIEVAARMGISRKAVEQHMHNAMQAIRRCREQADGARPG